ncbi:RNB domain-containing ribonuclease, partial [bacterium]|nr:RNB domain-containing ribonuclease [candidate division CSSED10-310 bacterium]
NLQRRERMARRQVWLEDVADWLAAVHENRPVETVPDDTESVIEMLKDVVLNGLEAASLRRVKELFRLMGVSSADLPMQLLVELGVWRESENLHLHRSGIEVEWPEEVRREAAALVAANGVIAPAVRAGRRDITHLPLMTIDSPSTLDIDDALSVETAGELIKVGVHISDVAQFIPSGSLLDQAAMDRGTSVYMPDLKIPMLPAELSEGLLSLVEGRERCAISLLATLDQEGELVEFEVVPTVVRIARRLTYDWVDEHLAGDPELVLLRDLALARRRQRVADGAVLQPKPEVEIWVDDQEQINVMVRKLEQPSHVMVAEWMIFANYLFARFLYENEVPGLYRRQPPPTEPVPEMGEYDPVVHYSLRKLMSRAEVSTEPGPHAGLGVPCYCTATSPIRRYADLLIQRQLHAAILPASTPLEAADLAQLMARIEPLISQANMLESTRHRYWLLRHLETRLGETFPGIVLERFSYKVRIAIPDLMLEQEIPLSASRELRAGQAVNVRVERVSAAHNHLFISVSPH